MSKRVLKGSATKLSKGKIRVLIADDSRAVLSSLCRYLELDGRFEIVGTAFNGVRLVHQVNRCQPDLVLVDLSMPQMNGLEATLQLRKSFPELRLLIYSGLHGVSLRDECLRSGADGFIKKSEMPESLMQEVTRLFPDTQISE
ncbi:MAG TPA: response regulator transcription factor [Candidatus Acidoferrum sp.]|nr:response regulator transcription factor [Candidatus Acidoferrum sp.]